MAYSIKASLCVRCFACVLRCPARAISTESDHSVPVIDLSACVNCGLCEKVCRPAAILNRTTS